jgi:hypothetical protein
MNDVDPVAWVNPTVFKASAQNNFFVESQRERSRR